MNKNYFKQKLSNYLKGIREGKDHDFIAHELEEIKSGKRTQGQIDFADKFRNIVAAVLAIGAILYFLIKYF
ncbi:MAG: hypothetical protein AAFZ15_01665 [Bacteroidota bacterium]